jgi:hypothetical protein
MPYLPEQLQAIFARTDGRCHLCGDRVFFSHYGRLDTAGAWEVEHSLPRAAGGTDHGNNLYAAHPSCNRSKCDGSTRAARILNGLTRAPLCAAKKEAIRERNTGVGLGVGIAVGSAVAGPLGALIGGVVGILIGDDIDVG